MLLNKHHARNRWNSLDSLLKLTSASETYTIRLIIDTCWSFVLICPQHLAVLPDPILCTVVQGRGTHLPFLQCRPVPSQTHVKVKATLWPPQPLWDRLKSKKPFHIEFNIFKADTHLYILSGLCSDIHICKLFFILITWWLIWPFELNVSLQE